MEEKPEERSEVFAILLKGEPEKRSKVSTIRLNDRKRRDLVGVCDPFEWKTGET